MEAIDLDTLIDRLIALRDARKCRCVRIVIGDELYVPVAVHKGTRGVTIVTKGILDAEPSPTRQEIYGPLTADIRATLDRATEHNRRGLTDADERGHGLRVCSTGGLSNDLASMEASEP